MKRMGDKKLSKAVSTKLTSKDFELCLKIARDHYINGIIGTPSVSELTRFALLRIIEAYRIRVKPPRGAQHPRFPRL
jgi:hypothetical protein